MTLVAASDGITLGSQKELTHYTKAVTGGTLHTMVSRVGNNPPTVAAAFQAGAMNGAKYTNVITGTGTASAGDLTGSPHVYVDFSGQAAITYTTRTATQMFGDYTGAQVGDAYRAVLTNRNTGVLTLVAGSGVTLSGSLTIRPGATREYHVVFTSATAMTMTPVVSASVSGALKAAQYNNVTTGTGTAAAGILTGAAVVTADYSGQAAITMTTRTAAQMIADYGGQVGDAYTLIVTNRNSDTLTLAAGSGVTITGTATLATNTTRTFIATVTGASALTLQSVSIGSIG